jgi:hypothetical protein
LTPSPALLSISTTSSGSYFALRMPPKRRRNPITPSPKKKATKKAQATQAQALATTPDVHLPGGALQTVFAVEGMCKLY